MRLGDGLVAREHNFYEVSSSCVSLRMLPALKPEPAGGGRHRCRVFPYSRAFQDCATPLRVGRSGGSRSQGRTPIQIWYHSYCKVTTGDSGLNETRRNCDDRSCRTVCFLLHLLMSYPIVRRHIAATSSFRPPPGECACDTL